ncbi:hypothetical protein HMI54_003601 [Coelomomyces lativittatus]|nr:hypothetical protein HMI54_003601 [Coelomomyces lativittatus]KAJ1513935.1 hypothetical protein HMI56_001474 [Coelomomyces lativittatus]KAJ1518150.1 hypothetical protein HMI55_002399 [Coelomomyces lativittatus]
MGQTASKSESHEHYVFTNPTTIRISDSLLQHLDHAAHPTTSSTSILTSQKQNEDLLKDSIPKAHLEKYIQTQVEERIQQQLALREESQHHAAPYLETLHSQSSLRDSTQLLEVIKNKKSIEISHECIEAKNLVTQCFLKHPTRSLNCSEEVEHFKDTVAKLQEQYLKSF